jgi:hypothetical protein
LRLAWGLPAGTRNPPTGRQLPGRSHHVQPARAAGGKEWPSLCIPAATTRLVTNEELRAACRNTSVVALEVRPYSGADPTCLSTRTLPSAATATVAEANGP